MFKKYTVRVILLIAIVLYALSMIVINLIFNFSDLWENSFRNLQRDLK